MKNVLATALIIAAGSALAEPAGYTEITMDAPHHGRPVTGTIHYPSVGSAPVQVIAENPVFQGVEVRPDDALADGQYPIVLLSHGMGGLTRSLAWLASDLAEEGAIVVSVNHPNTTWRDFDLAEGLKHWTRAQDVSLALDTLLADPRFEGRLDTSRIMAAGFSYGGWTAMSLGGLRGNHAGYAAHCVEHGAASAHCDQLMRGDVGLAEADAEMWNASYADARITHVVAIDPGLVWGLTASDTADLIDQTRIIGFGDGADRMLATDFDASGLTALVPDAEINQVVPGVHFTGMPLCKPMGAAILADEQDDPVCTDPEGTDRAAVHRQIVEWMMVDLGQQAMLTQ